MLEISLDELDRSLEKFVTKNFTEEINRLRTHLSDSPKQLDRYFRYDFGTLRSKITKLDQKILIGVLHWYLPEELKYIYHLWLEENWGADLTEVRDVLLVSKKTALGYLLIQDRWNNFDFYGNILSKNNFNLLKSFRFSLIKNTERVQKYTGYCRGYRESGKWTKHQPEKAIVKKLLTVEEVYEREEILKQRYQNLINLIDERMDQI